MADWSNFGTSVAGNASNMGMNLIQGSVSGLINNLFYRRNLNLQVEAQKELMDYQNAYNAPSAQMQRLAEAGLNPNLIYGSSSPSGQSGNASAPSGVANPGNFNTADVVGGMLRLQQAKAVDAQIENLRAEARLKNAQADQNTFYNTMQPELLRLTIDQGRKNLEKIASDMNLNESSVQYNNAKRDLTIADEQFRRGEISLQTYRQQQLVAQTNLFISETALNKMRTVQAASAAGESDARADYLRSENENMKIQNLVDSYELRFKQLFYGDDGKMLELANDEYKARRQKLQTEFVKDARDCGIIGPRFQAWDNYIFNRLEQASRIVRNVK